MNRNFISTDVRHLIIEGCDGSGKDTLIDQLTQAMPELTQHPRASTSLGGPVASLDEWVERDLWALRMDHTNRWIYNRHPLISEPIYAPVREVNPGLSGKFRDRNWCMMASETLARRSILVLCAPVLSEVSLNLRASIDGHMPGAVENWRHIYEQYERLVWPGTTIRYDYTRDTVQDLMKIISMIIEGKPNRGII